MHGSPTHSAGVESLPLVADVTGSPERREQAVHCLAHAFRQDPVMAYLFPREYGRLGRIHALYRMALRGYARNGHILLHRDGAAAAVWQSAFPPAPGPGQQLGDALEALWRLRTAAGRGFTVQRTMLAGKPEQPFGYLAMLGSHPAHRGSGAAGSLVRHILDECDQAGIGVYLESSHPDNIGYYRRFGFVVRGQLQIPGGPTLWPMWRAPEPPQAFNNLDGGADPERPFARDAAPAPAAGR